MLSSILNEVGSTAHRSVSVPYQPFYLKLFYRIHRAQVYVSCHFGSYKRGELREKRPKSRNSALKTSQLSWAGQYKKCVQYDFKFTTAIQWSNWLDNNKSHIILILYNIK